MKLWISSKRGEDQTDGRMNMTREDDKNFYFSLSCTLLSSLFAAPVLPCFLSLSVALTNYKAPKGSIQDSGLNECQVK